MARRHDYLYSLWVDIKKRCLNPRSSRFKYYGARGIMVHASWVHDFVAFRTWILGNLGDRPEGLTLDRVDTNGNYEPGNLRWATRATQSRNRRYVHLTQEKACTLRYVAATRNDLSQENLGWLFGIDQTSVSRVLSYTAWTA